MLVSEKGVGRQWGHRRRVSFGRRGRLKLLVGLWIALIIAGILLSAYFLWFPIAYWFLPGIFAFVIGLFGARRIWRYASRVHDPRTAWTRRVVMTFGLLGTGLLLALLYFSTLMSDITILYNSPYATQSSIANQAANMGTGFMMNFVALIIPIFFAFMMGEGYLLYRLRHHYSVSGF